MSGPFPVRPRAFDDEREGRRRLAIRVIGETGARAAGRPFAEVIHPAPRPRRRWRVLDRVPNDVARRALAKLNRLVVNRLGWLLLRARGGGPEAVRLVHELDLRCSELEHRVRTLEAELERAREGG